MGVRIKIKIHRDSNVIIETVALANTGYETEEPEILTPVGVAEKLGVWPELPLTTTIKPYGTPGGTVKMHRIVGVCSVQLITSDRLSERVDCSLVISELESEVLLSDRTLSALGVVIEDPASGLWRFRDEPHTTTRNSEKPELW